MHQVSNADEERGQDYRKLTNSFLVNDMLHDSIVWHHGSHSNPIKSAVSVLLLIDGWGRGAQTDSFTQHLLLVNNNWCYHNKNRNKFSNNSFCMFKPKHKRAVGCSEFKETVQLNLYGFFFFFWNASVIQLKMHVFSTRLMLMFGSAMAHFAFCNKWL